MRTGVHLVEETAEVPVCFESFEDYRNFLLEYRELLSAIVRLTAALMPEHALEVCFGHLNPCFSVLRLCFSSYFVVEEKKERLLAV